MRGGVGEQLAHDVELMVTRENLVPLLLAGLVVLLLDDLGVVLQDVRQPSGREDSLPEIIGLEPFAGWADCPPRRSSPG